MAKKAKYLLRKLRFLEWVSRRFNLSGLQWSVAVMLVSLCGSKIGYAYPTFEQMAENLKRFAFEVNRGIPKRAEM